MQTQFYLWLRLRLRLDQKASASGANATVPQKGGADFGDELETGVGDVGVG